jgi:hypothetical protein
VQRVPCHRLALSLQAVGLQQKSIIKCTEQKASVPRYRRPSWRSCSSIQCER